MAKLVKDGIKELNGNGLAVLPKMPPAGVEGVCQICRAKFITEENEIGMKIKIRRDRRRLVEYGWTMHCLYCGAENSVFFICLKTTLKNNQINLGNSSFNE